MLETNIWYKILKVVLYAALLMPLLVWNEFLFPFITTKVIYFRILIEAAFLIYFALALKYPEIRPRWSWLTRTVWIYLGVVVLASIFGISFYRSFWSTMERGEGIVTLLHFVLYFTMLTAVFRTPKQWFNYLLATLVSTFMVALVGIGQIYGLFGDLGKTQGERIVGTIGNAAFFAAVMIFGIFLSFYLILKVKEEYPKIQKQLKIFLWTIFILELIALYHSQTRGAILAVAGAGFIYGLIAVYKLKKTQWRVLAAGTILAIMIFGIIIRTAGNTAFFENSSTLRRLATISIDDTTVQSRFDTWQASLRGLGDRPILGYGYENFNIAFNKYFPVRIYKDEGSQIWFDRAHNIVFDVALTSGFLGLTVYIVIFGLALWYIFILRKKIGWAESGVLGVGLLAYFFQNLFVFDTQVTYLLFFIVLAHIVFLKHHYLPRKSKDIRHAGSLASYRGIVVGVIAVLTVVFSYFVNLEPALANRRMIDSIKSSLTGQYLQMRDQFEDAMEYGTYMDQEFRQRYHDMVIKAAAEGGLSSSEQQSNLQYVVEELEESRSGFPHDVRHYVYLLSGMNSLGRFQPEVLGEVFPLGQKALELSPTRPHIYYEMGRAALQKEDYGQSIEHFTKARDLSPWTRKAHMNLLLVAVIAGHKDLIKTETETLIETQGFSSRELVQIASAYRQAGDLRRVVDFYNRAIEKDSKDIELHLQLATVYGELCDMEGVRTAVTKAFELNSQIGVQGKIFIQEVEKKCQEN